MKTFTGYSFLRTPLLLFIIAFLFSCESVPSGPCSPFCIGDATQTPPVPPICPANCFSRPFCGCGSNSAFCSLCDDARVDDLTVFIDVSEIELSDGFGSPCPKSDVELTLDFLLFENPARGEDEWNAGGTARLAAFDMFGSSRGLGGVSDDGLVIDFFSFSVAVGGEIPFDPDMVMGPEIAFNFDNFVGTLLDTDEDQVIDTFEVIASGSVVEVDGADFFICEGSFATNLVGDVDLVVRQ